MASSVIISLLSMAAGLQAVDTTACVMTSLVLGLKSEELARQFHSEN